MLDQEKVSFVINSGYTVKLNIVRKAIYIKNKYTRILLDIDYNTYFKCFDYLESLAYIKTLYSLISFVNNSIH